MTIEEAIQHHRKVATTFKDKDSEQLADWLTELQEYRAKAQKKPKSNADRIRQMTDEELAKKLQCDSCLYRIMKSECESSDCASGILAWLRREVSEDETN